MFLNKMNYSLIFILNSFPGVPATVIRGFSGTITEATTYLERGYYLALTGFLCKVLF